MDVNNQFPNVGAEQTRTSDMLSDRKLIKLATLYTKADIGYTTYPFVSQLLKKCINQFFGVYFKYTKVFLILLGKNDVFLFCLREYPALKTLTERVISRPNSP